MRSSLLLVCVLIGVVGLAALGLYGRSGALERAPLSNGAAPREGIADRASPSQSFATVSEVDRLREQLAELSTRMDSISRELAGLHPAEDRAPVIDAGAPEQSSEEAFRTRHERTILAIIGEEREALALEARAAEIRRLVDGFWKTNDLREQGQEAVAEILVESEERHRDALLRIAPDGRYPAPDSAEARQLLPVEHELEEWRRTQLSRFLDSVRLEELVQNMRIFGLTRY